MLAVALSVVALMAAQAAAAQSAMPVVTSDQSAAHAPSSDMLSVKPGAEDNVMICHQIVYTGTRFASKECHTSREWKQMARDAEDYQKYVDMRAGNYCLSAGLCGK